MGGIARLGHRNRYTDPVPWGCEHCADAAQPSRLVLPVSGRGMNTPGPTLSSSGPNQAGADEVLEWMPKASGKQPDVRGDRNRGAASTSRRRSPTSSGSMPKTCATSARASTTGVSHSGLLKRGGSLQQCLVDGYFGPVDLSAVIKQYCSTHHEGARNNMYLDTANNVTVGIGRMLPNSQAGYNLGFV